MADSPASAAAIERACAAARSVGLGCRRWVNSPGSPSPTAYGSPVVGSTTEPTALTTTSAATVTPDGSTTLALPTPPRRSTGLGPRAGADVALGDGGTGRRGVCRPAVLAARSVGPRATASQVEEDRCGHDRHDTAGVGRRRHRPAPAVGGERVHDPVGRREPEGGATPEQHRVDPVDEVARVEQVGLPGAGASPAHVDPADRPSPWGQHHGDPREPARLVARAVADPHARDVDERVRRTGACGASHRTRGHRESRSSNSMSRPGELKPSRS